jgi:hypothetical protein
VKTLEDDMTKLIIAFHNFVNAPKNKCKENRRERMKEESRGKEYDSILNSEFLVNKQK